MTDAQRASMERFMDQRGAGNYETQVMEDIDGSGICGLPSGWILVTITTPKGTSVQIGIDPDGQGYM